MNNNKPPNDIRPGRLSPEQIAANFADMHPPLTPSEAIIDADRCYFCYDAPCTTACPTGIDIPGFIQKIRSGNLKGSANTILRKTSWAACARACVPTEVLCEQACVRNTHEDRPVRIGLLQRYATDADLRGRHSAVRASAGHRTQGRHCRRRSRGTLLRASPRDAGTRRDDIRAHGQARWTQ